MRATAYAGLVVLLAYLGVQNTGHYIMGYLGDMGGQNAPYDGSAYLVRQINQQAAAEGRPAPIYYSFGAFNIGWDHNANRFINFGTYGVDVRNPSNELPVIDNGGRDVVFIFQEVNKQYLPLVKSVLSGRGTGYFQYGPGPGGNRTYFTATYYRVKKEQVEARRVSEATYTPAAWSSRRAEGARTWHHQRAASRPGLSGACDLELRPDRACLCSLQFPGDRPRREQLGDRRPCGAEHRRDPEGRRRSDPGSRPARSRAYGHFERPERSGALDLVCRRFDARRDRPQIPVVGTRRGLLGEVQPGTGDQKGGPVLQKRVEAFLGFRHSTEALADNQPLTASWEGEFRPPRPAAMHSKSS